MSIIIHFIIKNFLMFSDKTYFICLVPKTLVPNNNISANRVFINVSAEFVSKQKIIALSYVLNTTHTQGCIVTITRVPIVV